MLTAVNAALHGAGLRAGDVEAAAFRLAGVDWAEDEAFWVEAVARELPGLSRVSIKNDGFAILRCGAISGTGVAVTALVRRWPPGVGTDVNTAHPGGFSTIWPGKVWAMPPFAQ